MPYAKPVAVIKKKGGSGGSSYFFVLPPGLCDTLGMKKGGRVSVAVTMENGIYVLSKDKRAITAHQLSQAGWTIKPRKSSSSAAAAAAQ